MELVLPDLRDGYVDLVRRIAETGAPASPRGIPTRELLGVTLVFRDTSRLIPVGVGRGVSVALNAYSAAALVAGLHMPEMAVRIAPAVASFDADGVDRERYGERIAEQLDGAVRHMTEDPDTREAIMTLQPARTSKADGGRDFPCTTSIQFLLREGLLGGQLLHMVVSMRSNDAWHGLSGDAWVFGQLQETVAWVMGAGVGTYTHHAASLHLYERDLPRLDKLHAAEGDGLGLARGLVPNEPWTNPDHRLALARMWARSALGVTTPAETATMTPSVNWYVERLRPFWGDPA